MKVIQVLHWLQKVGNVGILRQNKDESQDEGTSKRVDTEVKDSSRLGLWSKTPIMNCLYGRSINVSP